MSQDRAKRAAADVPTIRIGELARRAGLPAATLRSWERRYGIVSPGRTEGGYRLYTERDQARLTQMLELITQGLAPAQAAGRVLEEAALSQADETASIETRPDPLSDSDSERLGSSLLERLLDYDDVGAHAAIDRAIAAYGIEIMSSAVILPVVRRIGELCDAGAISVSEEHFASNLIRGRILALGRGWGVGRGRLALLVCPPDERHDLGLLVFGLLMFQRGWRIAFLGADTPLLAIEGASERLAPDLIVMAVTTTASAAAFKDCEPLQLGAPLMIAGAAATGELARRLQAELIDDGLLVAVDRLADATF